MGLTKAQIQDWDNHCSFVQKSTKSSLPTNQTYTEKRRFAQKLLSDPVLFKTTLFPHYAKLPDSKKHKELNRELLKHRELTQFRIAFRGFAKSVDADIIMPIMLMLKGENPTCAIIGENYDKACVLLGDCQAELQSNELILHYFGKQIGFGKWSEGEFTTKSGSLFKAFGINQSLAGLRKREHRLSYAVADDFDTHLVAGNPRRVKNYAYEIHGNIRAAMEGSEFKRLVIAQNRKVKDGILMELEKEMQNDPDTRIHVINVMDKKGKPAWPPRYDEKGIQKLQLKYTPRAFRAEFMNQPSKEGGIFKAEWIHWSEKEIKWQEFDCLFWHWDLSYTDQGDYKTASIIGLKNGKIYVVEIFCKKTDIETAMHTHYDWVQKCRALGVPFVSSFDATASQMPVFTPIWQKVAKARGIWEMPTAVSAPGKDKHLRVEATLSPLLMQSKIIFAKNLKGLPDTMAALDQLLTFEKGSKSHDDFPDSLEEVVRKAMQMSFSSEDLKNINAVTGNTTSRTRGNRRKF